MIKNKNGAIIIQNLKRMKLVPLKLNIKYFHWRKVIFLSEKMSLPTRLPKNLKFDHLSKINLKEYL